MSDEGTPGVAEDTGMTCDCWKLLCLQPGEVLPETCTPPCLVVRQESVFQWLWPMIAQQRDQIRRSSKERRADKRRRGARDQQHGNTTAGSPSAKHPRPELDPHEIAAAMECVFNPLESSGEEFVARCLWELWRKSATHLPLHDPKLRPLIVGEWEMWVPDGQPAGGEAFPCWPISCGTGCHLEMVLEQEVEVPAERLRRHWEDHPHWQEDLNAMTGAIWAAGRGEERCGRPPREWFPIAYMSLNAGRPPGYVDALWAKIEELCGKMVAQPAARRLTVESMVLVSSDPSNSSWQDTHVVQQVILPDARYLSEELLKGAYDTMKAHAAWACRAFGAEVGPVNLSAFGGPPPVARREDALDRSIAKLLTVKCDKRKFRKAKQFLALVYVAREEMHKGMHEARDWAREVQAQIEASGVRSLKDETRRAYERVNARINRRIERDGDLPPDL